MLRAYVRSFDAMGTIEKYLGTAECVVRRYGMTLAYERIYLLDNFWSSLESSWPFWNRRVRLLLSTITCSDRSPSNSSKLQADVMMTWQNARSLPRPDFSQERFGELANNKFGEENIWSSWRCSNTYELISVPAKHLTCNIPSSFTRCTLKSANIVQSWAPSTNATQNCQASSQFLNLKPTWGILLSISAITHRIRKINPTSVSSL